MCVYKKRKTVGEKKNEKWSVCEREKKKKRGKVGEKNLKKGNHF